MFKFWLHALCATFYVVMLAHPRIWLWFAVIWLVFHLVKAAEIAVRLLIARLWPEPDVAVMAAGSSADEEYLFAGDGLSTPVRRENQAKRDNREDYSASKPAKVIRAH